MDQEIKMPLDIKFGFDHHVFMPS